MCTLQVTVRGFFCSGLCACRDESEVFTLVIVSVCDYKTRCDISARSHRRNLCLNSVTMMQIFGLFLAESEMNVYGAIKNPIMAIMSVLREQTDSLLIVNSMKTLTKWQLYKGSSFNQSFCERAMEIFMQRGIKTRTYVPLY